jgi:hypothetical protein
MITSLVESVILAACYRSLGVSSPHRASIAVFLRENDAGPIGFMLCTSHIVAAETTARVGQMAEACSLGLPRLNWFRADNESGLEFADRVTEQVGSMFACGNGKAER